MFLFQDINTIHAELCQLSMKLEEIVLDMTLFGERISLSLNPTRINAAVGMQWNGPEKLPDARKQNLLNLEQKIIRYAVVVSFPRSQHLTKDFDVNSGYFRT